MGPVESQGVQGVAVTGVYDGSPAQDAGLQKGDVILSAGSKVISSPGQFSDLLGSLSPGSRLELSVLRDGKVLKVVTKTGAVPQSLESAFKKIEFPGFKWGAGTSEVMKEASRRYAAVKQAQNSIECKGKVGGRECDLAFSFTPKTRRLYQIEMKYGPYFANDATHFFKAILETLTSKYGAPQPTKYDSGALDFSWGRAGSILRVEVRQVGEDSTENMLISVVYKDFNLNDQAVRESESYDDF